MRIGFLTLILLLLVVPGRTYAQATSLTSDVPEVSKAIVLRVLSTAQLDTGTTTPHSYERVVEAKINTGTERGKVVILHTFYTDGDGQQLDFPDEVYVSRYKTTDSNAQLTVYTYSELDFDRLPVVLISLALLIGCAFWVGGKQGIRGLISLSAGISIILFFLIPGIIHGHSPLLLSMVVASFVATVGAYITHGISRMTTSAIIGMVCTIVLSTLLAELAVKLGHLTGITDETSYYLLTTPSSSPPISFQGLLLGGIIIGLLGVMYDAAIGQAVAVEELAHAGPHLSRSFIFHRAFRIGREHIGALVNTLVLAYVGVSLPIVITIYESLQYSGYSTPILNGEFLATEIVRTSVGAIGLMLTIPVTTWVAVRMLVPNSEPSDLETLAKEEKAASTVGHRHS